MTRLSQVNQIDLDQKADACRENARAKLLGFYRKVGNRAVAAALSIRSSYTTAPPAKAFVAANAIGKKKWLPRGA